MLAELPPPGLPITDGRPYLREEITGEFVVQGIGYLPLIDRIWATFRRAGFPDGGRAGYRGWHESFLAEHGGDAVAPQQVAAMSRNDCMFMLTFIYRGERFCDGMWCEAYRDGFFHALAMRLMELAGGDMRSSMLPGIGN